MNAPFTNQSMTPTTVFSPAPTQQSSATNLPYPYLPSAPHTVPYSSLAGAIEHFTQHAPLPQQHSGPSQLYTQSTGGGVRRTMSSATPKAHRIPNYQRSQPGTSYSGPPMQSHQRASSERFDASDPLAYRGASGLSFQQHEAGLDQISGLGKVRCPFRSLNSSLLCE